VCLGPPSADANHRDVMSKRRLAGVIDSSTHQKWVIPSSKLSSSASQPPEACANPRHNGKPSPVVTFTGPDRTDFSSGNCVVEAPFTRCRDDSHTDLMAVTYSGAACTGLHAPAFSGNKNKQIQDGELTVRDGTRSQAKKHIVPESFCLNGMKHSSGLDITGRLLVFEIVTHTNSDVVTTVRGVLGPSRPPAVVNREVLLPCTWLTRDMRRDGAWDGGGLIVEECDREDPEALAVADMDPRPVATCATFTTRTMDTTTRTSPRTVNFPALLEVHVTRHDGHYGNVTRPRRTHLSPLVMI
jgi:hypothetical protein